MAKFLRREQVAHQWRPQRRAQSNSLVSSGTRTSTSRRRSFSASAQNANIRWLILSHRRPCRTSASMMTSRGPANAPVTIVEFTDFQCPACAAMHPVIEEVLKSYGDKVRFVVRDFPEPSRARPQSCGSANARAQNFLNTPPCSSNGNRRWMSRRLRNTPANLGWTALASTRRSIAALTLPKSSVISRMARCTASE